MTYEPEATPPANEPDSVNPQLTDLQNRQPEDGMPKPEKPEGDTPQVEGDTPQVEAEDSTDKPSGEEDQLNSTETQSSGSSQEHPEAIHKNLDPNLDPNELGKSSGVFKGKVTFNAGLNFRCHPKREAKTGSKAHYNEVLNFDGWIIGEPWKEGMFSSQKQDNRWLKVAGQDWWLPAFYIEVEGELPSDLQLGIGGNDEA